MELILKQDVENLGFKDDVVTVKMDTEETFSSQKVNSLATSSAKKVLMENLKQRLSRRKKLLTTLLPWATS